MEKLSNYSLPKLIALRRDLHSHAEISFQEYETQKIIRSFLLSLNIPEADIKSCAKTGLIVDLRGKAPSEGEPLIIGFRADIDALEMKEKNEFLEYKSKNPNAAHACGHDGHTACLLGFACLFLDIIDQVPSNKGVRLFFQPSEEDTPGDLSGADCMVNEGALEGVDEVYALHNVPNEFGTCFVKTGYIAAEFLNVRLLIQGKGGHPADIGKSSDPIQPAVDILIALRDLVKKAQEKGNIFAFTLPYFHAGTANNVFADHAELKGTFRSIDSNFTKQFCEEFTKKSEEICEKQGFSIDISIKLTCPAIINTEKETKNIESLAKEYFGAEKVKDDLFPMLGSDDFAFFVQKKPGTYFAVGIGRPECQLHCPDYDFNDESLDLIAKFWFKICKNRLKF